MAFVCVSTAYKLFLKLFSVFLSPVWREGPSFFLFLQLMRAQLSGRAQPAGGGQVFSVFLFCFLKDLIAVLDIVVAVVVVVLAVVAAAVVVAVVVIVAAAVVGGPVTFVWEPGTQLDKP